MLLWLMNLEFRGGGAAPAPPADTTPVEIACGMLVPILDPVKGTFSVDMQPAGAFSDVAAPSGMLIPTADESGTLSPTTHTSGMLIPKPKC